MANTAPARPRGRLFDRNALDDEFQPAPVGHPVDDQFEVPGELATPAVHGEMRRKITGLPVDHLSINVLNGYVMEVFTRGAIGFAIAHGARIARSTAAITNLNAWIKGLDIKADAVSHELDDALDDAAAVKKSLDGEAPVPPSEPIVPRVPPRLGPPLPKAIVVGVIAVFGVLIDIINFKGVLDLFQLTLTGTENYLLATGFSTAAAGLAVIIGTTIGRRRRNGRARWWSWLNAVVPALVLLAMIGTSLLIRALNVTVTDVDPLGVNGSAAGGSPFSGTSGWLSAVFYTTVLVASSYASFDEARTIARFAPYWRIRRRIKNLIDDLRRLQEKIEYGENLRTEWMSWMSGTVARRDAAIIEHSAQCNGHFRMARELIAAKVGDPVVSDAIEHAPTIELPADVPPMDPTFDVPRSDPPTAAAA